MAQLYQGDLGLTESLTIGNDETIHKVKYKLRVSNDSFVNRTVKNDGGQTDGLFSFEMASIIAEKIRKNVDNAFDIRITKKMVSDNSTDGFGEELFGILWQSPPIEDAGTVTNDVTGQ